MITSSNTIVALSSGLPAAVALIRLSGKKSLELLKEIFTSKSKIIPRMMTYGTVNVDGISDNVMAVYFKQPNSFTGEDCVEIYTHASVPVINAIIDTLLSRGARMATAGEFSMRSMSNGKIDLTAAEGIISLINAQTKAQARAAFDLLDGRLKKMIDQLQGELAGVIALINADIDYPEENVAQDSIVTIEEALDSLIAQISGLVDSYNQGRLIKDGVKVALIGNVNVGKSSIINAILGKNRVIVSQKAGTTRDIVEDSYCYKGQKFVLFDTAGIRETDDEIENIGINLAKEAAKKADLVVSVGTFCNDFIHFEGENVIFVRNKIDLEGGLVEDNPNSIMRISALKNLGIEQLKEQIYLKTCGVSAKSDVFSAQNSGVSAKNEAFSAQIITDQRHYSCLKECLSDLQLARDGISVELSDCIAMQLAHAYDSLGQITGIVGSEEIIHEIFSRFCIGK